MTDRPPLALALWHGRKNPLEDLDDWGNDGPIFMANIVAGTYVSDITLQFHDGSVGTLQYYEDMVYYDGVYYGDWNVQPTDVVMTCPECVGRIEEFNRNKAVMPTKNKPTNEIKGRRLRIHA